MTLLLILFVCQHWKLWLGLVLLNPFMHRTYRSLWSTHASGIGRFRGGERCLGFGAGRDSGKQSVCQPKMFGFISIWMNYSTVPPCSVPPRAAACRKHILAPISLQDSNLQHEDQGLVPETLSLSQDSYDPSYVSILTCYVLLLQLDLCVICTDDSWNPEGASNYALLLIHSTLVQWFFTWGAWTTEPGL